MVTIAICDDDPTQLALITSYVSDFLQLHQYEASISQFVHPDELLTTCEKQRFMLYILDIVMPMVNGIEVGKAIRTLDAEAQILFVTYEPNFALQSFSAQPINYILKPVDKQDFFKTLLLALSKLIITTEHTFQIKTLEGVRVLRLSEVLCCEYIKHTVEYTLVGPKIVTTRVLKENFTQHVARLLEDERFIRPHISYVVNMDFIEIFNKTRFFLRYGNSVPIASKHYAVVRDRYMNYLLAKENSKWKN